MQRDSESLLISMATRNWDGDKLEENGKSEENASPTRQLIL
jgi:hypothetical protein